MFIDLHAHVYLYPCPPQDGRTQFCTPEQVIRRYDELGIDKGIIQPLIGPETYLPQSNQEVLEICRRYPDRFLPFCNIDPRGIDNSPETDFTPWLDWYKENGFLGVGEFMPNMSFRDPKVLNLMSQLEKYDMPLLFDVNTRVGEEYGLVDEPGMPQLEYCLRRFPKLTIFGHGPAFWAEIGTLDTPFDRGTYPSYPVRGDGAVVKLMRRYPNLWGDLSAGSGFNALNRDHDFAVKFINEFQDKLCFGTDICYADQKLPLADFLRRLNREGKISDDVLDKVSNRNIRRLLRLDAEP